MKLTSSQCGGILAGWALVLWNLAKFTFFYIGWMISMFAVEGLIHNDLRVSAGMLIFGVLVTAWMIIRMIWKQQFVRLTIVGVITIVMVVLMILGI